MHVTAQLAVQLRAYLIFIIIIKINCTQNAHSKLISCAINKMNVLFYPYIHTRYGCINFWETFARMIMYSSITTLFHNTANTTLVMFEDTLNE
jgi:hypothetical protein